MRATGAEGSGHPRTAKITAKPTDRPAKPSTKPAKPGRSNRDDVRSDVGLASSLRSSILRLSRQIRWQRGDGDEFLLVDACVAECGA